MTNRGESRVVELTRTQQATARRVAESRATVPHLELSETVELPEPIGGDELTGLLVWACARGLRAQPHGNAAYRDGAHILYSRINIGLLIETDEGLDSVTLFDADLWGRAELAEQVAELQRRAGAGTLTAPDRAGATFTLSQSSAEAAAPLIAGQQAAALCAGEPRAEPIVRGTAIVPGQVMTITLACDHRILYGQRAGRLVACVAEQLACWDD